jgi:hypothetical protein
MSSVNRSEGNENGEEGIKGELVTIMVTTALAVYLYFELEEAIKFCEMLPSALY